MRLRQNGESCVEYTLHRPGPWLVIRGRTVGRLLFLCAGDRQAADGGGLVQLSAGIPAGEPVRQRPAISTEPPAQHSARETS